MSIEKDFIVIGSGVAGLTFALKVCKFGSVGIITKDALEESATKYAQGGIASVMAEDDSFDLHVKDTMETGRGLCHEDFVRIACGEGPARVRELIELGANFDRRGRGTEFDLGKEAGHSKRRILHANDLTGWEIERTLIEAVHAQDNIEIFEHHMAIDLITRARLEENIQPGSDKDEALGLYVLDHQTQKVETIEGRVILMATGGAGKAGAKIANMEFFQFHPTCLFHPKAKSFLISETVRGEGGILRLQNGETFMENYHSLGCLAPRDVVARAIDYEMKKSGDDYVLLDATHLEGYRIRERFPNIYKTCLKFGFDMSKEPVPVVPAAHYMCGGLVVDVNGQTNIKRLFASGEVCFSGLHGANRLASNSLLEGLVLSHRAVEKAVALFKDSSSKRVSQAHRIPEWDPGSAVDSDESVVVSHNWDEIRRLMWNYVGIVRSTKRLKRAERRIQLLLEEIQEYYWNFKITKNTLELRNIAITAQLIIQGAMIRKESRGLHFNLDHPEPDDTNWKQDTVFQTTVHSLITQTNPRIVTHE